MRQIFPILLIFLLTACNLGQTSPAVESTIPASSESERLVVAWVESGNLMVWQTGDTLPRRIASGGVVQPFVSPDGNHIAYTRGAQSRAETLWIVDTAGTAEQQLIGERPDNYIPGENQIGDVIWSDERTIYLNTLILRAPFPEPLNDLYRVDSITREITRIAGEGEAGRLDISPDGQHLIAINHGRYGQEPGYIKLLNTENNTFTELMTFDAVSTASEFNFYPDVSWSADSANLLVAIPDPDLVYSDFGEGEIPETTLWQIPVNDPQNRGIIGTVPASFFGLPRWSYDGTAIAYLRRAEQSNQFTVFFADGNGANPQELFTASVGEVESPQWLPGANRYIFARPSNANDGTRNYFIGGTGLETEPLSAESAFQIRFLDDTHYIAVTPGNRRLDMRFVATRGESQFIGSLNDIPVFDAIYLD